MTPFFSIIIPSFNSAATIEAALKTVVKQTFQELEVWVIDGGSNDSTLFIVKQFALSDHRIKYLSESDKGIYDAMNKGVSHSSGEWLLFLGSDDSLYDENVLKDVFKVISNNRKTKFVYGDVMTSEQKLQRYNNHDYERLMELCICHQSIFYHRSLFKDRLYDLKYKLAADWDFNLKVFRKKNQPLYIERVISNFSLGGSSANWMNHPEYLQFFLLNKTATILRYRSLFFLVGLKVKRKLRAIKIKFY